MWIKNSDDRNEQEPLTALTALGLGQTMFGFAVRTLKARRKLASLFCTSANASPSELDTLVTAKEKANMLALGKKILGALLVLAGLSDLFVREPAHTITGPLLIIGGVALFLWGMRA